MKKVLIIALVLIGFQATAQEDRKEKRMEMKKARIEKLATMNPNDLAEIQSKKMTLHLDLTDAQQKKVSAVLLKNAEAKIAKAKTKVKAGDDYKKPSDEERIKMANERLDAKIATKREMKSILTADQYAKWEKTISKKGKKRKKGKKGRKRAMDKDKS